MKRLLNTVLFMFIAVLAWAQEPELTVEQHLEDYDFAVKYIEDNYAGFPDKVVDSTRADYEKLKTRLRGQVANGERPGYDAVAEYTAWFCDSHLKVHLGLVENGARINITEHYSKKKRIHYEGLMEYEPKPVACKVTDKTFLIRFPTCDRNLLDKKWVKNSIKLFKKSNCENLIIDIRNNGGGADDMFEPYLQLLYDHEGMTAGVEYRNTPENLKYEYIPAIAVKLAAKNPSAEFLTIKENDIIRYKKIDETVRKAALIIDNEVASSSEQMLLQVKACSNRTRVYGRDNTVGCLDYSNVKYVDFIHFDHVFGIPLSRRLGLPEGGIDATGIAPDVRIDLPLPARLTDNIDEWTIWVAEQLEQ